MENKIVFSKETVDKLNEYQKTGIFHPYTCGGSNLEECYRRHGKGKTYEEKECILIATEQGWICPCGKYTQNWAH